ncbi:hypothetical protein GCM10010441_29800 [Kitasatospora paracochleata]|uniref:TerD domain-containing protein n=1 Tax=Kitasatospora paracochleata TaxID=58354 RepID=A0ABT1J9R0_9ACTN|nr:hypothetical protein [Kitasatospora paracochleata]
MRRRPGALGDEYFVFYNNLKSPEGSVEHQGDNLTGDGDGDGDGDARVQNFGQVFNAYIRVVNLTGGEEIARYDLSEDASTETAMIFGELYRYQGEWKFRAVGQGYTSSEGQAPSLRQRRECSGGGSQPSSVSHRYGRSHVTGVAVAQSRPLVGNRAAHAAQRHVCPADHGLSASLPGSTGLVAGPAPASTNCPTSALSPLSAGGLDATSLLIEGLPGRR